MSISVALGDKFPTHSVRDGTGDDAISHFLMKIIMQRPQMSAASNMSAYLGRPGGDQLQPAARLPEHSGTSSQGCLW